VAIRRWIVLCLLGLALDGRAADPVAAALVDIDLPALSQRGDHVATLRDLRFRARNDGSIPVIVGLRMKSRPDASLAEAEQSAQRSRIATLQAALLDELAGSEVSNVKRFRYSPHVAVTVTPAALEALVESGWATSVEEDWAVTPSLAESVPLIKADKTRAAGYTGSGWAVAVLDTGVQRDHPFLGGRVVHEACFSTTNAEVTTACPNGSDQQIGTGAAAPCPDSGCDHGTHVAGIVAGSNSTLKGVAPAASIIAIQVFSRKNGCTTGKCQSAYSSDWILAMEHVYSLRNQYQIAAVNMSLGGSKFSSYCDGISGVQAAKQVIDNLRSVGIATIIATGNDGYADAIGFPSCISSAVSVGSVYDTGGYSNDCAGWTGGTSSADKVACSSNSASIMDFLAPGHVIQSSVPGSGYDLMAGTSMAAPHVAGCWAVLRQGKPSAGVDEIKQALSTHGTQVNDWRNGLNKPRIDCKSALDALTGTTNPSSADLQISGSGVSPAAVAAGAQISITATVRNAGTSASSASTLRYYRSTDATVTTSDSAEPCTTAVGSLAAGGSLSAPVCRISAPLAAGTYYYGVCVDAVGGESDTGNNCSPGHAVVVSAGGQADLAISALSAASQVAVGGTLSVSATIVNRGTAAAAASTASIYLSTNTIVTTYDTWIADCQVPALAAGASHTCSMSIPIGVAVTPGSYYPGVIADARGVVTETNEANNTLASTTLVKVVNNGGVTSLGDAVDATSLTWTTGGDANWSRETTTSVFGGDAAVSGTIGNDQVSYLQTVVTGPGQLSFYWKVSTEQDYDALAVLVDSDLIDYITGEQDWTSKTVTIPAGAHTVTWAYVKDAAIAGGQDRGWVDRVQFTADTGYRLTVSRVGVGSGTVSSLPAGIDCGTNCSASFTSGTQVTLTPRPAAGYYFAGWSGACSGLGACTVTMGAAAAVTAAFTRADDAFPALGSPPAGWSLTPSGSDAAWTVTDATAYGGLYSMRSGVIGDNGVTAITYTGDFTDGYVNFAAKISTEEGYDGAGFFIDDTLQMADSGEVDWTPYSYPITAGTHTLTWMYVKDESVSAGEDAFWIDSVSLPLANVGTGVLGTPGAGSTVSGVGVISGYHCKSKNIEVLVDGVSLGKAGAGTTLKGTQGVCGRTDTGYSLLYAFNNLINGQHVITVTADGVPFASSTVTTFQSGGKPWLSGVSRTVTVPDFPSAGHSATLQWVESYQNFLITAIDAPAQTGSSADSIDDPATPAAVISIGVLGTPAAGTTASGVGVISGYHCSSKNIEVFVDGVSLGKAGAGTTLKGTQSVCGHTDTGYSLLYAFNNLANGPHEIRATADGIDFASSTVTTFQSGGRPWLSGVSRVITVPDFPSAGKTATLQWVESYQNFLITGISGN
jgi:hypothetical protein